MSSNETPMRQRYANSANEDARSSSSRANSVEFHYTRKLAAQFISANPKLACGFFHCMDTSTDENPTTQSRRQFFAEMQDVGYTAEAILDQHERVIGKCHCIPVEYACITPETNDFLPAC